MQSVYQLLEFFLGMEKKYLSIKPRSYKDATRNQGKYNAQWDYLMSFSSLPSQITTLLSKTTQQEHKMGEKKNNPCKSPWIDEH